MFNFLGRYVFIAMEWLYENVIGNYAVAVILFTTALKLITLPADIKQRKSSQKLAAAQPDIQKIQKRYEGNPEIIQKKTMEYQKKHGINQFAGCLPSILTMLIFVIFFRGMTLWANVNTAKLFIAAQSGDLSFIERFRWLWVNNIWMPDSGLAPVVMTAQNFAKMPFDTMTHFFDASTLASLKSVAESITAGNSAVYDVVMNPVKLQFGDVSNGWFILPVIAGASMLLQQMIMTKTNPTAAATPGMGKGMMYAMAAVSVVVCVQSNAAFAIYWLASNIISMITTLIINRSLSAPGAEEVSVQ